LTPTDFAKFRSVKIDNGSGVLVNCLSDDFAYVFTAKHVPESDTPTITDYAGETIECLKIYRHSQADIDCAVILIKKKPGLILADVAIVNDVPIHDTCLLAGYPETRNNEADQGRRFKPQSAKITSYQNDVFTILADGSPAKPYIDGFSGTGVYWVKDDICKLIGIEARLDDKIIPIAGENFGRLRCYPISKLLEIIEGESLPELIPDFLSCFSKLKPDAFAFKLADSPSIEPIFDFLKNKTDKIIQSDLPKPYELYKQGIEITPLYPSDKEGLRHKLPWVHFLQHLLICQQIDAKPFDYSYWKTNERKRIFVFHNSEDTWLKSFREFLLLADSKLDANGIVIVSTPERDPSLTAHPGQAQKIADDISYVKVADGLIDNGDESSVNTIRIYHIAAMHKNCLIEQEFSYLDSKCLRTQMDIFRSGYGVYLNY